MDLGINGKTAIVTGAARYLVSGRVAPARGLVAQIEAAQVQVGREQSR